MLVARARKNRWTEWSWDVEATVRVRGERDVDERKIGILKAGSEIGEEYLANFCKREVKRILSPKAKKKASCWSHRWKCPRCVGDTLFANHAGLWGLESCPGGQVQCDTCMDEGWRQHGESESWVCPMFCKGDRHAVHASELRLIPYPRWLRAKLNIDYITPKIMQEDIFAEDLREADESSHEKEQQRQQELQERHDEEERWKRMTSACSSESDEDDVTSSTSDDDDDDDGSDDNCCFQKVNGVGGESSADDSVGSVSVQVIGVKSNVNVDDLRARLMIAIRRANEERLKQRLVEEWVEEFVHPSEKEVAICNKSHQSPAVEVGRETPCSSRQVIQQRADVNEEFSQREIVEFIAAGVGSSKSPPNRDLPDDEGFCDDPEVVVPIDANVMVEELKKPEVEQVGAVEDDKDVRVFEFAPRVKSVEEGNGRVESYRTKEARKRKRSAKEVPGQGKRTRDPGDYNTWGTKKGKPRPFKCPDCEYAAMTKQTLKVHGLSCARSKVAQTQHQCPFCSYNRAHAGDCRKHIRRVHKGEKWPAWVIQPRRKNC